MEEVESVVDYIIFKGYLVTSNDKKSEHEWIYSDKTLDTLVIKPLKDFVVKGFDWEVKRAFHSTNDALSVCTKFFDGGGVYYKCIDCKEEKTCFMCKECFQRSAHSSHNHRSKNTGTTGRFCDCGNTEVWKIFTDCSLHKKCTISDKHLPDNFTNKFSYIMKHLCNLLGKIALCDSAILESELCRMLTSYNNVKKSGMFDSYFSLGRFFKEEKTIKVDNDQKMCLLVFYNQFHTYHDMIPCFEACLPPGSQFRLSIHEMIFFGYTCIKYRSSNDECMLIKNKIDNYSGGRFIEFPLICKVVPVQILYFMRLSRRLSILIRELCSKKTQLCNILADTVFRDTSLVNSYVLKEQFLWMYFRHDILYNIIALTLCSESGKTYFSQFYIDNLDQIYTGYMMDVLDKEYCFINLISQFVTRPSVTAFLIENGFLCKMLDCITVSLNNLGIYKGTSVMKLFHQGQLIQLKLIRIFKFFKPIRKCLLTLFRLENWSDNFRPEIVKAGLRMIDFCSSFDDLEPFNIIQPTPDDELHFSYTRFLISYIHGYKIDLSRLLYNSPDFVISVIEKSTIKFRDEIYSMVGGDIDENAIKTLVAYSDIKNGEFSTFNLSRRFYVDLLLQTVLDTDSYTTKVFDHVFKDEAMLIWLSLPSVTSLSSYINNYYTNWYTNSPGLNRSYRIYRSKDSFHYFYMHDFTVIQILMSHMDADRFLKVLLFNIFPSLAEKSDFSQPLSSILSLSEFEHDLAFKEILVLIYNAISERHYIGKTIDYKYPLIEGQVINRLFLEDQSYANISKNIYIRRDNTKFNDDDVIKYLDPVLEKVSHATDKGNMNGKYSLKPEYYKQTNYYYFMYDIQESSASLERAVKLYEQNKYKFESPDVLELKNEFAGMNDFIFSPQFFELLLHSLKRQFVNLDMSESQKSHDFLVSLMCLCFILKLSTNKTIRSTYRENIDSMFVAFRDINNKDIQDILLEAKSYDNSTILSSIIDYFIKLMKETVDHMHEESNR